MQQHRLRRRGIVALTAGVSLAAFACSGVALADTNSGNNTNLAGVGSDTSQDVVEGLSGVISGISNYKATPIDTNITTRSSNAANCTFKRPQNSGEGRDALSAALRGAVFPTTVSGTQIQSPNMTGCVDFARSSSGSNPTIAPPKVGLLGGMTYIPFATDSVTYATTETTNVGHQLSKADLNAIYSATTGTGCFFEPLLPQFGSGTRSFFLGQIGLTDTTIGTPGGPGNCVKDKIGTTEIQEHDGRFLSNANQLIPFSTAQFIGQAGDTLISDHIGIGTLGAVDALNNGTFVSPLTTKSTAPFASDTVTFATRGSTNLGHSLSKADLASIYSANTGSCIGSPLLPAAPSTVRTNFLSKIGVATPGTCVKSQIGATNIPENDGRVLSNPDQIIPFDATSYINQAGEIGGAANNVGDASLGSIDISNTGSFVSPLLLKTSFTFSRAIYNVVSTAAITSGNGAFNSNVVNTFVSSSSAVCNQGNLIQAYGFAINATCGDTSKRNTN